MAENASAGRNVSLQVDSPETGLILLRVIFSDVGPGEMDWIASVIGYAILAAVETERRRHGGELHTVLNLRSFA